MPDTNSGTVSTSATDTGGLIELPTGYAAVLLASCALVSFVAYLTIVGQQILPYQNAALVVGMGYTVQHMIDHLVGKGHDDV